MDENRFFNSFAGFPGNAFVFHSMISRQIEADGIIDGLFRFQ